MRFLVTLLLLATGMLAYAQNFPTRPNAHTTNSLRNGDQAREHQDKKQLDSTYATFGASVAAAVQNGRHSESAVCFLFVTDGKLPLQQPLYDSSRPFYQRAANIAENPLVKSKWVYRQVIECLASQSWADDDYQGSINTKLC